MIDEAVHMNDSEIERRKKAIFNTVLRRCSRKGTRQIIIPMKTETTEEYQKLTPFQKDVVDALINLGFEHKYFSIWELKGWGSVNVSKFSRWSDVLKYVHEQGKDQKRFEFQRVLGI
jgi:hypothetical protein